MISADTYAEREIDNLTGGIIHQKKDIATNYIETRKRKAKKNFDVISSPVKRLIRAESQAFCLK